MHNEFPSDNGTIRVHVTLPGALAKHRPTPCDRAPFEVTLLRGSTLRDLLVQLQLPDDRPNDLFVNRQRCVPEDVLPHAAEVEIFPALGAGGNGPTR